MFRIKEPKLFSIRKLSAHDAEWIAIHAIADSGSVQMIDAFLKAVARTKGSIVLKDVEDALAVGNINAAIELIPWDIFSKEMSQIDVVFRNIYNAAGIKSIDYLPKDIRVQTTFNTLNKKSLDYISEHTGKLIVEITEQTRLGVLDIMNSAFVDGMHPYESARYVREIVGLTQRQSGAVDNLRKKLTSKGVAKKLIEKKVKSYSHRLLVYRSNNISRTETLRAASMGQQSLWTQNAKIGLIDRNTTKRVWITTPDDRLCPYCKSLNGKIVGLEEEFKSGNISGRGYTSLTSPLHPMCRCAMGLVFE